MGFVTNAKAVWYHLHIKQSDECVTGSGELAEWEDCNDIDQTIKAYVNVGIDIWYGGRVKCSTHQHKNMENILLLCAI